MTRGASPTTAPTATATTATTAAFDPRRLRWQLTRDAVLRAALLLAAVALLVGVTLFEGPLAMGFAAGLAAAMLGYFLMLTVSARASAALAQASVATDADPAAAESAVLDALARVPLLRSLRLMLYHRLAVLRQRQGRSAEAAAICDGVLAIPLGRARPVRPSLLLLACEARLDVGDVGGAWHALVELYRTRVTLQESLQRLWLRTRYELAAGHDAAALSRLDSRLQLAELMPPDRGAEVHRLLADAAERVGHPAAGRLRRKAELLGTPPRVDVLGCPRRGVCYASPDGSRPLRQRVLLLVYPARDPRRVGIASTL